MLQHYRVVHMWQKLSCKIDYRNSLIYTNVHYKNLPPHFINYDMLHQSVPGNGHCLYYAVALYTQLGPQVLRNTVAEHKV